MSRVGAHRRPLRGVRGWGDSPPGVRSWVFTPGLGVPVGEAARSSQLRSRAALATEGRTDGQTDGLFAVPGRGRCSYGAIAYWGAAALPPRTGHPGGTRATTDSCCRRRDGGVGANRSGEIRISPLRRLARSSPPSLLPSRTRQQPRRGTFQPVALGAGIALSP